MLQYLIFFLAVCLFAGRESALAKSPKYELAVCAIFQNEAPYLKEWIEFHKLLGVEHFYLYNNLSKDKYAKILKPYIKKGEVKLIKWEYQTNTDGGNWPTIQCMAYNDAIKRAKRKVRWLAFLDVDEFLFPVEKYSLVDFLKDYRAFSQVSANWQMYGTSGIKKIPDGKLLIETLVQKAPADYPDNIHVKSIVRPEHVENCGCAHYCTLKPGYFQVTANKEIFEGPFAPSIDVSKLRINHYWSRAEDFLFEQKISRGKKWQRDANGILDVVEKLSGCEDTAIFKYVPELRDRLKLEEVNNRE